MQGVYVLRDTITAVTAAKVLLALLVPSTGVIEILSAKVTCQDEDTSEQIFVTLARATGTRAGGDALTAKPTEERSSAFPGTCVGGNTDITGLTQDVDSEALASMGANKLGGWEYVPLPEERTATAPDAQITLETIDAMVSCDLTAEIIFRFIG